MQDHLISICSTGNFVTVFEKNIQNFTCYILRNLIYASDGNLNFQQPSSLQHHMILQKLFKWCSKNIIRVANSFANYTYICLSKSFNLL